MTKADEPAFPTDVTYVVDNMVHGKDRLPGLTNRELFAAIFHHAQILGNFTRGVVPKESSMKEIRMGSIKEADALIKALGEE